MFYLRRLRKSASFSNHAQFERDAATLASYWFVEHLVIWGSILQKVDVNVIYNVFI